MIKKFLKNHPLYAECLIALKTEPLEIEASNSLHEVFKQDYPITKWGKIDWSKIRCKKQLNNLSEIVPTLKAFLKKSVDENAYIQWSDGGLPLIKANLTAIINNFDDVDCVAFDKFIFNLSQRYIIEVPADGTITVGVLDK